MPPLGARLAVLDRVLRSLALLALLATSAGCPVALAVPPTRTELAPTTIAAEGPAATGFRVATGAAWASGTLRPGPGHDVDAGYVYERLDDPGGPRAPAAEKPATATTVRSLHGAYVAYNKALSRHGARRSWAGARAELLFDGDQPVPGISARVSYELFAPGERSGPIEDRCAAGVWATRGTHAAGLFFETGYRRMPGERDALVVTAGLSVRMPVMGMFGFVIPGCR